jgi:imidazolonepropionase
MRLVDLLLHNAAQVVTCAGPGPRRGAAMREACVIADGAVAVDEGRIVAAGPSALLRGQFAAREQVDLRGRVLCPGFVDPHTHVVFAGDRIAEFEQRIQGRSYQDIAAAGGGIVASMRAVRAASEEQIVEQTHGRLRQMLRLGTTTAEAKTGYGLDLDSELKLLRATEVLAQEQVVELVPTFLGAHAIPPEYRGRGDEYVAQVIGQMLPAVRGWYEDSTFAENGLPLFVDVFCEKNAFDVAQSRRVLEAARALGLPLKAHVDEFTELGGLDLALALGATSVDHLDVTGAAGIARLAASASIGVIIPTVNFNLGASHFAAARDMIDAGAALALTTDINPGSAPCPSMPLAMAIACRYQKLLPAEALVASTLNAAYAIGLGDRAGSIEPGKQADLLVIDAPDYRWLAYEFGGNRVAQVYKRGRVVT